MSEQNGYLVAGETGEYSDHRLWFVKVFTDKARADAFCERLNAWCVEMGCTESRGKLENEEPRPCPPEDPDFSIDYTGTKYSVAEIPMDTAETLPVAKG